MNKGEVGDRYRVGRDGIGWHVIRGSKVLSVTDDGSSMTVWSPYPYSRSAHVRYFGSELAAVAWCQVAAGIGHRGDVCRGDEITCPLPHVSGPFETVRVIVTRFMSGHVALARRLDALYWEVLYRRQFDDVWMSIATFDRTRDGFQAACLHAKIAERTRWLVTRAWTAAGYKQGYYDQFSEVVMPFYTRLLDDARIQARIVGISDASDAKYVDRIGLRHRRGTFDVPNPHCVNDFVQLLDDERSERFGVDDAVLFFLDFTPTKRLARRPRVMRQAA